jgi:glucose/arabinose dehydrogenase
MSTTVRAPAAAGLLLVAVTALPVSGCGDGDPEVGGATVTAEPSDDGPSDDGPSDDGPSDDGSEPDPPARPEVVATVADGLSVPWGIDFLPDGSAIVTERDTTRVLRITADGEVDELGRVGAEPEGEGGLLGVAVSPDFVTDSSVYLYLTTAEDNRVVRVPYDGARLGDPEVVLDGIPNGFIHDGGRLAFGPDGMLYVSTGETGEPSLAQDRDSLGGKILRVTPDGEPAPGNPFAGSPVWSWGHRNVQGLAFDDDDRLWASEFGDSTWDELNRIEKGDNYGWPEVEGQGNREELTDPQVVWRTEDASPSGLAYLDGHVWMAALRGARLWRVDVSTGTAKDPQDFFVGDYGRMRAVVVAPDGNLWVTTSNRDGRGEPAAQDDRILVVDVNGG